jgi:LysM repeat protein/ABC-type branched-subunit amino acid transport system substrate-binding protein
MAGFLKFQFSVLFVIVFYLSEFCPVYAQSEPTPVEKSTEKILYQGKVYFIHTVKKGQTLYSISRAYNVTAQDITSANPGIQFNPLSEGQSLHIPAISQPDQNNVSRKDEIRDNFIYHTVDPNETPYSLHVKYNISVEEIYKNNPGADKGLRIGQVIKIPTTQAVQANKKEVQRVPEKFTSYELKKGDNLTDIALKYNVSVADLVNANESLRWGLKPGLVIVIPGNSKNSLTLSKTRNDSILSQDNYLKSYKTNCDSILQKRSGSVIKLALILPFYASESFIPDSTSINDSTEDSDMRAKNNVFKGSGAVEFYEGVLLAMDSLRKEGTKIDLYVYDDEGDTSKTTKIIHKLDSIKPDAIIGPLNSDNARIVSKFCKRTGTIFVPPLVKEDSILKRNPFLFQPTPSSEIEIKSSIDYLSQYQGQNIILVHKPDLLMQDELEQFKVQLKITFSQLITDSSRFKELLIDVTKTINIKSLLRNDLKNIVIILSSQEPDVSNVLTQLYTYSRYYDIMVFGLPSWQKFKNVRIDYLHDLQVTMFTPFYIDYNDEIVKYFIHSCRSKLGFEPYRTTSKGTGLNYTFYGFDLTFYFATISKKYGKDALLCADNYKPRLLLTNYTFKRNLQNGCLENNNLNLIRYNKDYSIEKLDYKSTVSH